MENAYLVQRFGNETEKVPEGIGILHVRLRVTLLRVNKVRELQRVANEEDWCVVANHVPVTFLGVKFERESTRVTRRVGEPGLSRNS